MPDFSNIATAFHALGLDQGRNYEVRQEVHQREGVLNNHLSAKELTDIVRKIKDENLIAKGIDILDQGPKEVRYELQPSYKGELHLSVQKCLGLRVSVEFRANSSFDKWHTVLEFVAHKKEQEKAAYQTV